MPRLRAGRHDIARVPSPPAGYPIVPASTRNTLATLSLVAVPDPYDERRRQRAVARLDLLDRERRARRIDEASYLAGREVEACFEQMSRIGGGGQWLEGDRIEGGLVAELKTVLGVDRAHRVNGYLAMLVRQLGRTDSRLLWTVLGQGQSFMAAAATVFRRDGRRAQDYAADRFRDALARLAEARAAKGTGLRSGGRPLSLGIAVSHTQPEPE